MADESTLWVGGLAEQVTEDHLYELFLQAGPLTKVTRPKDKDGTLKKFAFVEFNHAESVPYAMQVMDGVKLFHHHLRLKGRQQSSGPDGGHGAAHSYQDNRGGGGRDDYHRSRSFQDDRRHHTPSSSSGPMNYNPGHHHHRGMNRSHSDDRRGGSLSQANSSNSGYSPSHMQPQSFEDRRSRVLHKQSTGPNYQAHQNYNQGMQNPYGGYNNYNQQQYYQNHRHK